MNISNGLEYLNNTKRKLATRLQGKGVNVTNDTPFSSYPDSVESELQNKSWSYPSTWYPLTPKAEFPDHTVEAVFFDADYTFTLHILGSGTLSVTVFGSTPAGRYYIDEQEYEVNLMYTISPGTHTFRFNKGIGIPCNMPDFTTVKAVFTFSSHLTGFWSTPNTESAIRHAIIPLLAVRVRDTSTYTKTIYFGDNSRTYRSQMLYMQYCDLSMVTGLQARVGQFYDCHQLVKVEVPQGFMPGNSAFVRNYNLEEVKGMDFETEAKKLAVFAYCNKFKPPTFNLLGNESYYGCCLSGKNVKVSQNLTAYPGYFYLADSGLTHSASPEAIGNKYRIILPDTMVEFPHNALKQLNDGAIIQLPSCHATLNSDPIYETVNSADAFIAGVYRIENGENFYLDKPIGIYIPDTAFYEEEHLYLPHVPLRYLRAVNGNLKKITFDWDNTNFDGDCLGYTNNFYVIDISYQKFDYEDLMELFEALPIPPITRNIKITGNPGVSNLTRDDLDFVMSKGYTITM